MVDRAKFQKQVKVQNVRLSYLMFVSPRLSIMLGAVITRNSSRYKKAGKDSVVVADGKDTRGVGVMGVMGT